MDDLIPAICDKLEFSWQTLPRTPAGNCAERSATKGTVDHATRHHMVSMPPFEQVFRALGRTLRQADLP